MPDLALRILMSAQDNGAGGMISGLGMALRKIPTPIAIAGAALVGIGALSVKMAADFQTGITKLETSAGESANNLTMVGDGIKNLSIDTATSTSQLLKGMYMVESAGFHGAAGLAVLSAASRGARAENADLGEVTNTVTSALNAYSLGSDQAISVTNSLVATVGVGKMTMGDLAASLSNVLPAASAAGVGLHDVEGAIATMTMQGDDAASAATHLRQLILALVSPAKAGAGALRSIGLSSGEVAGEMKVSLPGAIQMIVDHLKHKFPEGSTAYITALKNISGGSKQMMAMLELTGGHLKVFGNNVNQISGQVAKGGKSVFGFAEVSKTFNFQVAQMASAISVLLINIGQKLLPILSMVLAAIIPVIASFATWVGSSNGLSAVLGRIGGVISGTIGVISSIVGFMNRWRGVIMAVGGALLIFMLPALIQMGVQAAITGAIMLATVIPSLFTMATAGIVAAVTAIPGLIAGFVGWAIAGWAAAAATIAATWPILLIIAAIALLVVGIYLLITHWKQVSAFLAGAWHALAGLATSAFNAVKNAIVSAFNSTIAWIVGAWHSVLGFLDGVWHGIKSGVSAAWKFIVNVVKIGAMLVLAVILGPFLAIGALFIWLYHHNYYFKALIDSIVHIVQSGLAWLEGAWKATIGWLGGAWHSLTGIASAAFNAVSNVVMSVVNTVTGWLKSIWSADVAQLTAIWNTLSGLATAAFNAVSSVVMSIVNTVVGWLKGIWDTEVRDIQTIWNKMASFAQSAWDRVVSVFSSAWGRISGVLSSLWSSISGWFSNLANQALSWGANVIAQFAAGITSKIGAVTGAVSNIVNGVKNLLGFHSPTKEGPGKDSDTWAPNLMKMFAQGLMDNLPKLKIAVAAAAQAIQDGLFPDAMALHDQINAAQEAMVKAHDQQVAATWNKQRHHARGTHPNFGSQATALGVFSSSIKDMNDPNQTSTTTTNGAPIINLHIHAMTNDPKQLAKLAANELTKKLNNSQTHTEMTSGGKVA